MNNNVKGCDYIKRETSSLNTKKALSASLKKFMEQKALSKITVSEIIADCHVNRKTFYYHFADIYDLLKWTLEQETVEVIKQFDLLVEYWEALQYIIDYVENNKHILNCAYDTIGRNEMKRFFYNDFINIMSYIVDHVEQGLQLKIDADFKQFIAEFYTEAIAGILLNLFQEKKTHKSKEITDNIIFIFEHSVPNILLSKSNQPKDEHFPFV